MAKRYIKEKGLARAVTTDNLNLEKPLVNEHYDIDVHNRNMDKLDSAIKEDKSKISSLESNVNENKKSILDTQAKQGDLSQLKTSNKTNLVNAVNELFQNANNGKSTIATSVGSPLLATDTFSAMGTKINTIKSNLATAITSKGVSSSSSETFANLTNKIGQISTVQKVTAGESVRLLKDSYTNVSIGSQSTNYTYGTEVCGCKIFATGSIRVKFDFSWTSGSASKATLFIVANRNGTDILLKSTTATGTSGSTTSYTFDVNIVNGDYVSVRGQQPYGTYPSVRGRGFWCNLA